ncbi:MAG: replication-associated recombination protein A [Lentisphaeria bacterium]|nr:replication-associated recombination protein A [Lentisphaeria bacterium]
MDFNLFDTAEDTVNYGYSESCSGQPLAARLRPQKLEDYVGQDHILAPGKLLRRAIDADMFHSIIFSGPPGVGKTSLAELIAKTTNCAFIRLSGVTSTVADIRKAIADAVQLKKECGRRTVLFIDEIHRFNKSQQDSLLPDVENGNIRLIGATTHNVQFYIVGALLSRSLVFILRPLTEQNIETLLLKAAQNPAGFPNRKVNIAPEAVRFLANACEGDARKALNAMELAVLTTLPDADGITTVTLECAEDSIQKKFIHYDDDAHYDSASAFIKSMRGSDADAAIYYLARMLSGNEDIRFIARRLMIFASEDIGNADPHALQVAVSAAQAVDMVGMPEARIILAQAVTYCATAPKSNASYTAINQALEDIEKNRVQPIPVHLRDSHSNPGSDTVKNQADYKYPHASGGFVVQDYMTVEKSYYEPKNIGYESKIKERIDYWKSLRSAEKNGSFKN